METRSSTPGILGILSIVFGAIVVALSLIGLGAGPADFPLLHELEDLSRALSELEAKTEPWATMSSAVMIAMGAWLIAVGVGQRGYRRWAKTATIVWSSVALLVTAAQVLLQLLVLGPALARFTKEALGGMLSQFASGQQVSAVLIILALYLPYPIVTLVLIRKREVAESMVA